MKIVLATPLYPPDIAEPAPYVKELAGRLAGEYQVVIVAYTQIPEKVPRVYIQAVAKSLALPVRLFLYTWDLLAAALHADIVYAQNGASVELPASLVALISRKPLILGLSDKAAHERARGHKDLSLLERFCIWSAKEVIDEMPNERPEILPFGESPAAALTAYEESWKIHLAKLKEIFTTYGS